MRTEAEAFLQRIRAYPDDDAPRLIFADWLAEHGDPDRARFIRVQLALARLVEEPSGVGFDYETTRANLMREDQLLLEAHREEWEAPFRGGLATSPRFHRGFVEEVNVAARQLIARAAQLFDTGPIRHIHLLDVGGSAAAALSCTFLSRLRALTIPRQHAGEPLARAVARSPHLSGLKSLALPRNRFEDDAVAHLACSPTLTNLEELDLSENDLGETAAHILATSTHLGQLRNLELRANRLGPCGAEAIAASERLPNLHRLGLGENEIGSHRVAAAESLHALLRVPILDLSVNGLTAAALQAILNPRADPESIRLVELDLRHNELGNEGARVLAHSRHMAGVKVLRLVGCGIEDDGARALAESPHLNRLVELDLSNNPIDDSGLRAFLDTPHLRSLRRLIVPFAASRSMRAALDARFLRGRL